MKDDRSQSLVPRRRCEEWNKHNDRDVSHHVCYHPESSERSMSVGKLHNSIEKPCLQQIEWNPQARSEDNKGIGKHNKWPVALVFVIVVLLYSTMNTKQQVKMMQIRIMIKFVGMAVVRIGVLVLPHDGIAQQRHAPNTDIIDQRTTRGRKVAGIMAQGANQPTKDSKQKGT